MSSEFHEISLSDICTDVNYGYTESATSEPIGPKFLRITDIQGGIFNWEKVPFCPASESNVKKYRLEIGDIVIARTGNSTGENAQIINKPPPAVFASYLIRFRPDRKRVNPFFIGYQLRLERFQQHVLSVRSGSAQPGANAKQLGAFSIQLIPREFQDAAVETLRALDDRIALLRETNATLEAIAQALFKSWFVDFDPVRAKMEGRAPEGMDEATAALFPDSFEESALGLVPKGWRVRPLDEVANYLNGLALQKFPPKDDAWLPVIKIAQLRKGDTVGADRAGRNIKPDYVIKNGDVLFSWSGSLEVEIWCGGEGALNQHLFKVTSDKYPKWFYYFWTKHYLEHFRQIAASKATTMGHIQRMHLTQAKVIAPPDELVSAVGEYFAPLLERWITTALQAKTLATLRDTLLPRLISGQLRLPEAGALLEESAA
jgi:type I restriction enzyme S subunit